MRLWKTTKIFSIILLLIFIDLPANAKVPIKLCLTGRLVENLPVYGETLQKAVSLARDQKHLEKSVVIQNYFYDNKSLEPIRIYNQMKREGCSAIIGFEYLSDLLLVSKIQGKASIPIFTSYASTLEKSTFPKNIFILMPSYHFLAGKMMSFLQKRLGKINDVLLATEINRDSMRGYQKAYRYFLNKQRIKFDTFNFLENDEGMEKKLRFFLNNKHKHYRFVFLLSGAIASSKIANCMNDHQTIFIGTENYGSSINPSFYLRLQDKTIRSYFIRNLSYLKMNKRLKRFMWQYQKKYQAQPTLLSAYAYDAATILLQAFQETGSVEVDHLFRTHYQGITNVTMSRQQFHRSMDVVILSVGKNGYRYEE